LALLALFIALGGSAYAAAKIDSRDIANNAVKSKDLKDGKAVAGADVVDESLTGADIDESTLGGAKRSHTARATADIAVSAVPDPYPFDGGSGAYVQRANEAVVFAGTATVAFGSGCNPGSYGTVAVELDGALAAFATASKTTVEGTPQTFAAPVEGIVLASNPSPITRTLSADVSGECFDPDGSDARITDLSIDALAVP
jgi:hypothetical protein